VKALKDSAAGECRSSRKEAEEGKSTEERVRGEHDIMVAIDIKPFYSSIEALGPPLLRDPFDRESLSPAKQIQAKGHAKQALPRSETAAEEEKRGA
jgi:hypothetical protein